MCILSANLVAFYTQISQRRAQIYDGYLENKSFSLEVFIKNSGMQHLPQSLVIQTDLPCTSPVVTVVV